MVNGLGLCLGLWCGLGLSRKDNGAGLGFGLWSALRPRVMAGAKA